MSAIRLLVTPLLCSTVIGAVLPKAAFAVTPDELCNNVRAEATEHAIKWFGLDENGRLIALRQGVGVNKRAIEKIIYLHRRDDGNTDATVVAVKITFRTEGNDIDRNWIRLKNQFKDAFSVSYQVYQEFHNGTAEDFDIRNNFHLSEGWFRHIPFTTFDPTGRRSQLRYADVGENDERTFRSYLFTLEGVQAAGTCIDFKPFVPDATKALHVQVIDLRENVEAAIYYHGFLDIELQE
jgi:predicted small secreted protein